MRSYLREKWARIRFKVRPTDEELLRSHLRKHTNYDDNKIERIVQNYRKVIKKEA